MRVRACEHAWLRSCVRACMQPCVRASFGCEGTPPCQARGVGEQCRWHTGGAADLAMHQPPLGYHSWQLGWKGWIRGVCLGIPLLVGTGVAIGEAGDVGRHKLETTTSASPQQSSITIPISMQKAGTPLLCRAGSPFAGGCDCGGRCHSWRSCCCGRRWWWWWCCCCCCQLLTWLLSIVLLPLAFLTAGSWKCFGQSYCARGVASAASFALPGSAKNIAKFTH